MRIRIPLGLKRASYILSSGRQVMQVQRCFWVSIRRTPVRYGVHGLVVRWSLRRR